MTRRQPRTSGKARGLQAAKSAPYSAEYLRHGFRCRSYTISARNTNMGFIVRRITQFVTDPRTHRPISDPPWVKIAAMLYCCSCAGSTIAGPPLAWRQLPGGVRLRSWAQRVRIVALLGGLWPDGEPPERPAKRLVDRADRPRQHARRGIHRGQTPGSCDDAGVRVRSPRHDRKRESTHEPDRIQVNRGAVLEGVTCPALAVRSGAGLVGQRFTKFAPPEC